MKQHPFNPSAETIPGLLPEFADIPPRRLFELTEAVELVDATPTLEV